MSRAKQLLFLITPFTPEILIFSEQNIARSQELQAYAVPLFKGYCVPASSQTCHLDRSEERAKWRDLAFGVILMQNGKISPLQNLFRQIFPVEMTQLKLVGTQ